MPKRGLISQGQTPHWRGDCWRMWVILEQRPRRRRAVYGRTPEECHQKADALLRKLEAGMDLSSERTTVAQYADYWLEQVVARRVAAKSLKNYRDDLRHPLRLLGRKPLDRLTELDVERAVVTIADEVSDRAAVKGLAMLKRSLEHARRRGRLPKNPADIESPVSYSSEAFAVWSGEEVVAFLRSAEEGSSFYPLFYTALNLGLRSGEMFALPKRYVYLDRLKLEVRRTTTTDARGRLIIQEHPKTHYSARTLDLSPEHAAILAEAMERSRGELALPNAAGNPHSYTNVRRALHAIALRAGVRPIRPHDLRHTFASLYIATMCERGEFDIYSFSRDIMGHQNAAFTMRQYGHVVKRYQRARRAYSLHELTGHHDPKNDPTGVTNGKPN